jgi:hypothetical protein
MACGGGDQPDIGKGSVGWRCTPPPEGFEESDLIGTWRQFGTGDRETDKLILREDGTYQHILEDVDIERYESPWNAWRLESRPYGGFYLHLEGMRQCEYGDEVCNLPEGGGGNKRYYDFCENRYVTMQGEVILSIVGDDDPNDPLHTPRGFELMHMRSIADSSSNTYWTEEGP